MAKTIKTPKQIAKSGKPFQTTIIIRSQRGLDLLAKCRERHYDTSAVIDKLLEVYGTELAKNLGVDSLLDQKFFSWPAPRGVRR
jgi:hypothetical protein